MKKFLLFLFALPYMALAQNALPDTEIFLVDVKNDKGKISLSNLKNITNRTGYDNQPFFLNKDSILYVSMREDNQADVYLYSLKTNKIVQITNTPEHEFSPTIAYVDSVKVQKESGGKIIYKKFRMMTCVRVEQDSSQRLWKFGLFQPMNPKPLLEEQKGIGYHCWVNKNKIGLFILAQPHTLNLADIRHDYVYPVDTNIGRTLQRVSDNKLAYCSKKDTAKWAIKIMDIGDCYNKPCYGISYVIELPKNAEDFIYGPDEAYWVGSGSKLLRYKPGTDKDWVEIHDFKGTPAENFYRLAFSADGKKLALVGYMGTKP